MRISVIGAGYVGLVTAVSMAEIGHHVHIVERDAIRRRLIARAKAPIREPGLDEALSAAWQSGRLTISDSLGDAAAESELTLIAVSTPMGPNRAIDLSFVEAAVDDVVSALPSEFDAHTLVIRSTVVPGTADGVLQRRITQRLGTAAERIHLAVNPEFLRQGSALGDMRAPDRIIIGTESVIAVQQMQALYANVEAPKFITNTRTAEMIKYANNTLLATLVSYSNELAAIAEATGRVDFDAVLAGLAADRRWYATGNQDCPGILSYLKPSPGFGGSCLPKDLAALISNAEKFGAAPRLLRAVEQVNRTTPVRIVDLLEGELGDLSARRIAVLGLTFKSGTDDLRSSPSLNLMQALSRRGAHVALSDPTVTPETVRHTGLVAPAAEITDSTEQCLTDADAAVLAVAHPQYRHLDWDAAAARMAHPHIFDIWGVLDNVTLPAKLLRRKPGYGELHRAAA